MSNASNIGGEHLQGLDGRVAIVTGGGRGIGRGISELLAANGATVAINYRRDAQAAQQTVDAISAAGGSAKAYAASVGEAEECAALVDAVIADFGGVDILVCNAGIASRGNSVADTDPAEMIRVVNVHAFGPHHMSRLVLPSMRTTPSGNAFMLVSSPRIWLSDAFGAVLYASLRSSINGLLSGERAGTGAPRIERAAAICGRNCGGLQAKMSSST